MLFDKQHHSLFCDSRSSQPSAQTCFLVMSNEDNSPNGDGPKYKVSSFLFGNVNKEGQIEEYQHDDELKSINNLDRCRIREVEEAASDVLSDNNNHPVLFLSPKDDNNQLTTNLNSTDYYNEEEIIADELVEEVLYSMKPEKIKTDDYDSSDSEQETSSTVKGKCDSKTTLTEDGCTLPEKKATNELSPTRPQDEIKLDESNIDRKTQESLSPSSNAESIYSNKHTNYAQISVSEDTTLIMPPPLHPAPLSASRSNQAKPVYSRNADSPISSPIATGYHSESVRSPQYNENILNTPLGSLMPAEYANVDIKELFPSYDPGKTPLWGRLFRLPHQLGVYREFVERYDYIEEILTQRPSRSDRQHLVYDGILDLGEIPLPEDIIYDDEVVELNTPPMPGLDYLAGSENSWWRRAFKAALDELMNPKNEKSDQDDINNKKDPYLSVKSSIRQQQVCIDENHKKNGSKYEADVDGNNYLGWRLGPAKYWYDQLGLPLDINVCEWTEWRRTITTTVTSISNCTNSVLPPPPPPPLTTATTERDEHNNHNNTDPVGTHESVIETVNKDLNCPTIKKEHIDDESFKEDASNVVCSKQDPDDCQQRLPADSSVHSSSTMRKNSLRGLYSEDLPAPDHFHPYQLLNWEDDIIYDPQLSANKISTNSRLNAAYAGWIPSQHYRTMASFQDAYQGKFPFILSSKIINGLATFSSSTIGMIMESLLNNPSKNKTHSNPPYSIFPVENEGILKDTWVHDIIYDSDLPVNQQPPPFLLTLDQNDETCILEPIDDATIASALSSIRNQRQKLLMNRGLEGESDTVTGDYANSTTTGNNIRGNIANGQDGNWSNLNSLNDIDNSLSHNKSNNGTVNRTSLQVNFGLASTRGMFTGALAKAEKGAEKVKMILGKHGLLAEDDWQSSQTEKLMNTDEKTDNLQELNEFNSDGNALASAAAAVSGIPPKDPLNLSNDEYYAIRSGALALGGLARCGPLQHSTPTMELWPPFFPTYMSPLRLRQFHRIPLKRYLRGPMSQYNTPFPVTNLTRHIHRKMREREDERAATGGVKFSS
ncbi:unnamed protein product [Heterobilharzia americana]|nr:unnamed protein product [Heterobilharzia americana]